MRRCPPGDASEAEQRESRQHELQPVGKLEQNTVAGADAQLDHARGILVHEPIKLAVRDPSPAGDDGDALRMPFRTPVQFFAKRIRLPIPFGDILLLRHDIHC